MVHTIPAPAGTFILDREQGAEHAFRIPVIGYTFVQGGVAFPITVMPNRGLTKGRALLTPDGFVSDPAYGIVCATAAEWMQLSSKADYWSKPSMVPDAPADVPDDPVEEGARRADAAHRADEAYRRKDSSGSFDTALLANRIPDKPKVKKPPRIFKTNSYWHFQRGAKPDTKWDAVWMIPGGTPVPGEDEPYVKITGEEFKAHKKAGVSELDPRSGPLAQEMADRHSADRHMGDLAGQQPDADEDDITDLV